MNCIKLFISSLGSCREVYDSMMKAGEAQARLKQVEVALDTTLLDKENAEAEAALAKERAESSRSEIKRLELMVSRILSTL